jgi:hypothetical protein
MIYKVISILCAVLFITSCTEPDPDAATLLDESIEAHGVNIMGNTQMDFNFRGIDYSVEREAGTFKYHRYLKIGNDSIHDILDNNGFSRLKNDTLMKLPDSLSNRYRNSLNSVVYFAQLPYGLDSKAVHKRFVKKDTIANKVYNEIEVTFDENGGGEDHEDVFLYWINEETHFIDYLAYSFCEEECGFRFRESINRRTINGVTVQDYNNYKLDSMDFKLSELDAQFEAGRLTKVSTIELRRVVVE